MNIFLIVLAALVLLITIAHMHRRKQAKNKELLVIDDNCTGCRRCAKRCQRKALEIVNKKVVLSPDRCTACGNCVPMCKFNALEIINRESK
ncbi:MAG: DUF362 domain-containing protein [Dysgonomonas sp.]